MYLDVSSSGDDLNMYQIVPTWHVDLFMGSRTDDVLGSLEPQQNRAPETGKLGETMKNSPKNPIWEL
jgi:hypothetical protein